MVRLQAVVLTQEQLFGEIVLRKHKMFDVVFSGKAADENAPSEDALNKIDERYQ